MQLFMSIKLHFSAALKWKTSRFGFRVKVRFSRPTRT